MVDEKVAWTVDTTVGSMAAWKVATMVVQTVGLMVELKARNWVE